MINDGRKTILKKRITGVFILCGMFMTILYGYVNKLSLGELVYKMGYTITISAFIGFFLVLF